jgi:hypothetical protein
VYVIPRLEADVMKTQLNQERMSMQRERMLGVMLLVSGLIIAGAAVSRMGGEGTVQAQVTPQAPPAAATPDEKPAQSMPGGTRPTTPAPEPARPQNNEGSTTGASPASPGTGDRPPVTGTPLPQAPAEKTAPPIERK